MNKHHHKLAKRYLTKPPHLLLALLAAITPAFTETGKPGTDTAAPDTLTPEAQIQVLRASLNLSLARTQELEAKARTHKAEDEYVAAFQAVASQAGKEGCQVNIGDMKWVCPRKEEKKK